MKCAPSPYRKTVLVCTNVHEDGRPSCGDPARGGGAISETLKAAAKKAGLKSKVRIVSTGCLGLCEHGPNAMIQPDDEWLSAMTLADVETVLKRLAE
ncbi:MAG: (2Fe-2S) ferredoxin domain-containing protein [Elusimicrobiota bacterium]